MFFCCVVCLVCLSCSQMDDPFAQLKQLHQAQPESIDRKQDDLPFAPERPAAGQAPRYFWEEQ